jgi:hypothetical protein
MRRLASQERFEEAEELRVQAATLARSLERAAAIRALIAAGDVLMACGPRLVLLRRGTLAHAFDPGDENAPQLAPATEEPPTYLSPAAERECAVIVSWLRRQDGSARLISVTGSWSMPAGCRPSTTFDRRDPPAGVTRR